jgi:hypothetical protein
MDSNPYSDDDEIDERSTYWRRRAVTLAAGLGVLGLLAWALSGGGGKPGTPQASGSGSMSAAAYPSVTAPSATTSPGPSAGADVAVPGLGTPGTSGLPSASAPASSAAKKPVANVTSGSGGTDGRCPSSAIVLSLFASQSSYASGQDPKFSLDAVSTAAGTCTFNVSPAQLHLVVMSAGRVIWDSADCARTGQTQTDRLTRGVPVQRSFAWNRTITLPGCVTLASAARPGTYTAQVRGSSVASVVRTFRLAH